MTQAEAQKALRDMGITPAVTGAQKLIIDHLIAVADGRADIAEASLDVMRLLQRATTPDED